MIKISVFGNRLKYAMKVQNIKPSDISKWTGIGKSSISQWISGEYVAKQDKVKELAKILNVNDSWLTGYNDSVTRNDNYLVKENNELKYENERLRKKLDIISIIMDRFKV